VFAERGIDLSSECELQLVPAHAMNRALSEEIMKKVNTKKLLLGFIGVFVLFQVVATELGSIRGEAGIIVGLLVVVATLTVERLLFTKSVSSAAKAIGLGRPTAVGIIAAIVIASLMLLLVVGFAWQTGSTIELYPNWPWLALGLFFQAGIAEETLFRGYLFGHFRQQHPFTKAVFFAAIPFVLVHLFLFYSLPWSLAGASILLAIAMSFPLSKLFELGGDTMWAPAIVHFAAQAIAKMIVPSGEHAWLFPFLVIAASAIVPLAVYAVPVVTKVMRGRIVASAT
jgi:membrane protease YdiL (CAAX protease family)